ncbi:DUF6098 family protein [Streptomyces sp. NPDC048197]|uniref:DUF6098 family protein n=1 Tax=Streptomyces sp. NPDC048197 TaxID=3365511 RepID=UPI0037205059
MPDSGRLPTLHTLDELAALVERRPHLYVRWSRGPEADVGRSSSTDDLTGASLPGLSANALDVPPWWQGRPTRVWVARRLHDYSHLPREKGSAVRPWVLHGHEAGRGPDNEPLVRSVEPIAWISSRVLKQAKAEVDRQAGLWGSLQRKR